MYNLTFKKVLVLFISLCLVLSVGLTAGCNKNEPDDDSPKTYVLSALKKTINVDEEYQLEVVGATNEKISWSVDDKKVASVSENGLVKGLTEGNTKVWARVNGKQLSCEIVVKIKLVDYVEISLPNEVDDTITLLVGNSYTFAPELIGTDENAQIILTTDSSSLTVDGYTITAVSKVENAKLTFTCNLDGVSPVVFYVTVV